jgi:multimeric flavodoxin WrbA
MVAVHQHCYGLTQNEKEVSTGESRIPRKILSIQAAPRGRRGATEAIAGSFVEGMEAAGTSVNKVYLADLDVKMCKGCFKCWKGPHSKCDIDDDLASLLVSIPSYDLLVISTPLYVDGVPGILKNLIDRSMILNHPSVICRDGFYLHPSLHERLPNMVLVSVCALPGNKNFRLLADYMQSVGRHMHMPLIATIFRPETMSFMHPKAVKVLEDLRMNLLEAGKQMASKGIVEKELVKLISRPILAEEEYLCLSNEWWR